MTTINKQRVAALVLAAMVAAAGAFAASATFADEAHAIGNVATSMDDGGY